MAATVVLSPAKTDRNSAVISVPAGSVYNFYLYSDVDALPAQGGAAVHIANPDGSKGIVLADLDAEHSYSGGVEGPCDVIVHIPASSVNLGVARYP